MSKTQIAPLLCPPRRRLGLATVRTAGLGVLLLGTLACSRVPELENRLTEDLMSQPYPTLLPLDLTPPAHQSAAEDASDLAENLDARAARLRRRAASLRAQDI